MIVTISYGVDTEPETLYHVHDITETVDSRGGGNVVVLEYYDEFDHLRNKIIRYTNYVTITIH